MNSLLKTKYRGYPKAAPLAHRAMRPTTEAIAPGADTKTTGSMSDDWNWQTSRGRVIWLYGRSGAGKSTLSRVLAKRLELDGYRTVILDGDELRRGLNAGLGFSDADRTENIRRAAEVAKLFAEAGTTVIAALMTPLRSQRDLVRQILGAEVLPVFVSVPWEVCADRDVKGLYAQAAVGVIGNFTPRQAPFEEPGLDEDGAIITAHGEPIGTTLGELLEEVGPWLRGEVTRSAALGGSGDGI